MISRSECCGCLPTTEDKNQRSQTQTHIATRHHPLPTFAIAVVLAAIIGREPSVDTTLQDVRATRGKLAVVLHRLHEPPRRITRVVPRIPPSVHEVGYQAVSNDRRIGQYHSGRLSSHQPATATATHSHTQPYTNNREMRTHQAQRSDGQVVISTQVVNLTHLIKAPRDEQQATQGDESVSPPVPHEPGAEMRVPSCQRRAILGHRR